MNGKIRFRIWLKKEKKMVYLVCSEIATDWVGEIQSISVNSIDYPEIGDRTFQKEDFILMTFTGLSDKNKQEIWDGDIVKTYAIFANPTKEKDIERLIKKLDIKDIDTRWNNKVWEVKFMAGSFGLWKPNPIFLNLGHFAKIQLEIIGNIYQNKELLSTNK